MIEYLTFFERAKESSRQLINISDEQINRVLLDLATRVLEESTVLMDANTLDLNLIEQSDPMYERVIISEDKIKHIAESLTQVSQLESPLHRKVDQKMLSNGLYLEKVSVPLGVLGVIAEARPNLTFDLFALSLKSGNALLIMVFEMPIHNR